MKTISSKSLMMGLTISILFVFAGCQRKFDASSDLQDEQQRNEIFNAIINDHSYMDQFMQSMKGNNHAQMMMKGNKGMMGMMMTDTADVRNMMNMMQGNSQMMGSMMGQMMQMCNKDSTLRNNMMGMMMNHSDMMRSMMTRMNQAGLMDKNCLMKGMKQLK
jgi:hypothetical protein